MKLPDQGSRSRFPCDRLPCSRAASGIGASASSLGLRCRGAHFPFSAKWVGFVLKHLKKTGWVRPCQKHRSGPERHPEFDPFPCEDGLVGKKTNHKSITNQQNLFIAWCTGLPSWAVSQNWEMGLPHRLSSLSAISHGHK